MREKTYEELRNETDKIFSEAAEGKDGFVIKGGKDDLVLISAELLNERINEIVLAEKLDQAQREERLGLKPISYDEFKHRSEEMRRNARDQNRISS